MGEVALRWYCLVVAAIAATTVIGVKSAPVPHADVLGYGAGLLVLVLGIIVGIVLDSRRKAAAKA